MGVVGELLRAGDIDIERLKSGADAADDLGRPEGIAEDGDPAIAGFADRTKSVPGIGGLVGVQATTGEFGFERWILTLRGGSNAKAESFRFETEEQGAEDLDRGLGNHEATRGGLAVSDVVRIAEVANAIEVAEEIEDTGIRRGKSEQCGGPDRGGFGAADGFAAFGFDEFEAEGFNVSAELQGLDVQGI
jgi:hypothetical protein